MKITRRQLRQIISESAGEMRSQEAISGAQTHMRTDGMSFQDFAGLIVDKLNLYDEWLSNSSVEDVVANLAGGGTDSDDWEPGPGYDASGIDESETNEGTPLSEMPASWQQILRTKS